MKPTKDTVTFHVDKGISQEVLEADLEREGYSLEEAQGAIDDLVAEGVLTRGRSHPKDSGIWIVVTAWSPNMAATIRELTP